MPAFKPAIASERSSRKPSRWSRRFARGALFAAAMLAGVGMLGTAAPAQGLRVIRPAGAPAVAGNVNLPYSVADSQGNQWVFYNYGQFQHQGQMPVYSQGGMLQINGGYPTVRNNQARVDEKTGEIVLENMMANNVAVTRRILVNREEGYIRYIDILRNPGNQDITPNLVLNTNLNYGVQQATTVTDPKKQGQQIAWAALTHANGRCVVEMYAGKGAKVAPTIQYQQGNSNVQVHFRPTIPPGKEVAWMHFHATANSLDQAQKFPLQMKESKVMASIPPAIRKLIVNFRGGENFIGDHEILRGDILDVVELRSGDQLKGTLREKAFKLDTFYGAVELPVDKVIALINAGEFRPRQLVVTKDGEVFGGRLAQEKLTLELSSGQVTEIPLSQVSRMGYRKRMGELEEWTFDKPLILMRTGDRIGVQMPTEPIQVATRYGTITLKPESVAAINFQSEEHGVHDVYLTDGSKFAGLVTADAFEMKLGGDPGAPVQTVRFPAASIRRLQLARADDDAAVAAEADEQAVLSLANDDNLVGALTGTLKLDTAFSTLTVNAGEIKRLVRAPGGSPSDVQVTLWDETTVSGQLQEQALSVQLVSGVAIKVPVALVEEYEQPRPRPSDQVVETIKKLVADLSAEDWKARDGAQERLITMGAVVISTLKELRPSQSPEAQQRIDLILKQVEGADEKKPGAPRAGAAAPPPAVAPGLALEFDDPAPVQLQQIQAAEVFQVKG